MKSAGHASPDWVAENRDNPLRQWDGRSHISSVRHRNAVAQYRTSRAAVVDALGTGADADALTAIGREYGEAFNKLDGRSPFIETDERDELVDAPDTTVDVAEATLGCSFPQARSQLRAGLESVRTW